MEVLTSTTTVGKTRIPPTAVAERGSSPSGTSRGGGASRDPDDEAEEKHAEGDDDDDDHHPPTQEAVRESDDTRRRREEDIPSTRSTVVLVPPPPCRAPEMQSDEDDASEGEAKRRRGEREEGEGSHHHPFAPLDEGSTILPSTFTLVGGGGRVSGVLSSSSLQEEAETLCEQLRLLHGRPTSREEPIEAEEKEWSRERSGGGRSSGLPPPHTVPRVSHHFTAQATQMMQSAASNGAEALEVVGRVSCALTDLLTKMFAAAPTEMLSLWTPTMQETTGGMESVSNGMTTKPSMGKEAQRHAEGGGEGDGKAEESEQKKVSAEAGGGTSDHMGASSSFCASPMACYASTPLPHLLPLMVRELEGLMRANEEYTTFLRSE